MTHDTSLTPEVTRLIDGYRSGHSLPQAFYTDPAIFNQDMERIFHRRWLLADHAARIPEVGDYFLYSIGEESVIVIRDKPRSIAAFFNVCRHRGSKICLNEQGRAQRLTCPYHAWTYSLDGRLISARKMKADFDPAAYGLRRCQVEVVEGLIYLNLGSRPPMDFSQVRRSITPFLALQGTSRARIAKRETFREKANWKLVVENFLECYHCLPAHPEYCSVADVVKLIGEGSPTGSAEFLDYWQRWKAGPLRPALADTVVSSAPGDAFNPRDPYAIAHRTADDGTVQEPVFAAMRSPIGEGMESMSANGKPVAPLMGQFERYDGGKTNVSVDYFARFTGSNDYGVLFKFLPVAPQVTDFEIIWLVDEQAVEGHDYDLEQLTWLWKVTTAQDKILAENNQLGVNSIAYVPGPYSDLEGATQGFVDWYIDQVK